MGEPQAPTSPLLAALDAARQAQVDRDRLRCLLAAGGSAAAVRLGLWPPDRELRISGGRR
jgi:hypothetical protein